MVIRPSRPLILREKMLRSPVPAHTRNGRCEVAAGSTPDAEERQQHVVHDLFQEIVRDGVVAKEELLPE